MSSYTTQYGKDHPEWREAEKNRNNECEKIDTIMTLIIKNNKKNEHWNDTIV
jgi:hypothetical protein